MSDSFPCSSATNTAANRSERFHRTGVQRPGLTFKPGRRFTVEDMETLPISEVAQRPGVPATTLRYYEDIGLIGPAHRAPNGYRTFNERDLERLALITRAKKLDLSLEDVRDLVAALDSE